MRNGGYEVNHTCPAYEKIRLIIAPADVIFFIKSYRGFHFLLRSVREYEVFRNRTGCSEDVQEISECLDFLRFYRRRFQLPWITLGCPENQKGS